MISYPLYLIHENAGVAIIIKMGRLTNFPNAALPFVTLAILVIPAYLIASYLEPALQRYLKAQAIRRLGSPQSVQS